jgi:hypothetical protein
MTDQLVFLLPLLLIVAILYSSVGHGGASGYLAVFSLMGFAPAPLVPIVLTMNILVASISFLHFRKPGKFSFRMLLPFIITSIPAAYLGGLWRLSSDLFPFVLGIALLAASLRLFGFQPKPRAEKLDTASLWKIALPIGLILGLVSGMIGIGGGVFLSPILIFLGLTDTKGSAAMSSAFIVLNSISGLIAGAGHPIAVAPVFFISCVAAGFAGALIGANWGALRMQARKLQYVLATVLVLASVKLISQGFPFGGR